MDIYLIFNEQMITNIFYTERKKQKFKQDGNKK